MIGVNRSQLWLIWSATVPVAFVRLRPAICKRLDSDLTLQSKLLRPFVRIVL